MVTKGSLTNPRELIDNRVGGLVNVTRPDAVTPMPQAPLNPFIFQTIKLLDESAEETSSISSLSTGLNKDAISKQNSQGMVEQLVNMSQQHEDYSQTVCITVYKATVERNLQACR